MIEHGNGDLLTGDTDATVNTVNTVGVMGKGVALQVKRAFPDAYAAYRTACQRGEVEIGRMLVHDRGVLGPARYVINFPTKRHWRSPSRLADIDAGLDDLRRVLAELSVSSVAVPALGCGNGGLDWREVRPRIEAALGGLSVVRVVLYPPAGAQAADARAGRHTATTDDDREGVDRPPGRPPTRRPTLP
ncbi:MAG: macro domain-containing protein [Kineosporiaceae bacterium]